MNNQQLICILYSAQRWQRTPFRPRHVRTRSSQTTIWAVGRVIETVVGKHPLIVGFPLYFQL